jgi:hypothetical protein
MKLLSFWLDRMITGEKKLKPGHEQLRQTFMKLYKDFTQLHYTSLTLLK